MFEEFYRHWSMKEAFIKAIGIGKWPGAAYIKFALMHMFIVCPPHTQPHTGHVATGCALGLGFELHRADFSYADGEARSKVTVKIDGTPQPDWHFGGSVWPRAAGVSADGSSLTILNVDFNCSAPGRRCIRNGYLGRRPRRMYRTGAARAILSDVQTDDALLPRWQTRCVVAVG